MSHSDQVEKTGWRSANPKAAYSHHLECVGYIGELKMMGKTLSKKEMR